MKRLAYVLLLGGCGKAPDDGLIRVANWAADAPAYPFARGSEEASSCRVELVFDPADLPSVEHLPRFTPVPELEAALNSIDVGDCYGRAVTSYVYALDYDADGDSDFVVRRPRSAAACELPDVGVVRRESDGYAAFERFEGLTHLFLIGSVDGDQQPDLVAMDQGCAYLRVHDPVLGYDHAELLTIGCGEDIGAEENTPTTWDLDRDGDLDLLLASNGLNRYYRNDLTDSGGGFVEAIAAVGLTPSYALEPNTSFDKLRANSFYIYCDHEDPFDPASATLCQVDNDGTRSYNESYRCDATGSCTWVEDRVPSACDRITLPHFERYLCGLDISPSQFENLVIAAELTLGQTRDQVLHLAHSSGSPASGDNSNPMGIARFGIWPYAFEYKSQSDGLVNDSVAVFDVDRYRAGAGGWLPFEPYTIDNGRSTENHDPQTWATIALEDGSGWPTLLSAHGKLGPLDQVSGVPPTGLLEQLVEAPLACLQPDSPTFGVSDIGVTTIGADGRLVAHGEIVERDGGWVSTGPIERLSVYKTMSARWIRHDGAAPRQHLLLGGFDGVVHAHAIEPAGAMLRLVLDPGPGRAPHGYGAVVFIELDGRLRGPLIVGADGVQPQLGNHRDSWDLGLGQASEANVFVRWPWGELEGFAEVPAGVEVRTLVHGEGTPDPVLPDALAELLDARH